MKTKVRHIDFVADEYITGVGAVLNAEEQGVYWMICALIYSHGTKVEEDKHRISALCKIRPSKAQRIIDRLVDMGKLHRNGSYLTQNRSENEVKRAQKRIKTARENGSKGGRPKKENKDLDKPGGSASRKANHQLPTTNDHSSLQSESPPPPTTLCPPASPEQIFERWWADFPRHRRGAKGPARNRWLSIVKRRKATTEDLMNGLERYNAAGYRDSRFASGAERWLNGEYWTCERFAPPGDAPDAGDDRSDLMQALDEIGDKFRERDTDPIH